MFLEVGLKLQAAVTGDSDDTNMCRWNGICHDLQDCQPGVRQ
jgi:hypothetical protein